jgi:chromate transporter
VLEAVLRIGKRALKNRLMVVIAALAFIAIFFVQAPFPLVVLTAGLFGFFGQRLRPQAFPWAGAVPSAVADQSVIERMWGAGELEHTRPSTPRALGVAAVSITLWVAPVAALALGLGWSSVFVQEAVFFSKAALVTFGGAYAVLAYVAQRAVETYGWLRPGEMLDGLGLAETTPGPLIMVVQFVGFLGAFRHSGALSPMVAGLVGSLVTVWVTFVPCFFWIFLGAPYVEALRGHRPLHAALSSITAAVVGVILNLSVWFGAHTLFRVVEEVHMGPLRLLLPSWTSVELPAVALGVVAMLAIFRFKLGVPKTLALCTAAGALWKLQMA